MRNSSIIILEIIWITTGILCIAAGIKYTIANGYSKVPAFALMALVCFIFAWVRHKQRKKS